QAVYSSPRTATSAGVAKSYDVAYSYGVAQDFPAGNLMYAHSPKWMFHVELVDIMLKRMDPDLDGVINFQDFHDTVLKTPSLLESLGYCLPERPAVFSFVATWCPRWGKM
ncbi:hypothetical protein SFRURICE_006395, partial [Spodoptera frugiperda]